MKTFLLSVVGCLLSFNVQAEIVNLKCDLKEVDKDKAFRGYITKKTRSGRGGIRLDTETGRMSLDSVSRVYDFEDEDCRIRDTYYLCEKDERDESDGDPILNILHSVKLDRSDLYVDAAESRNYVWKNPRHSEWQWEDDTRKDITGYCEITRNKI